MTEEDLEYHNRRFLSWCAAGLRSGELRRSEYMRGLQARFNAKYATGLVLLPRWHRLTLGDFLDGVREEARRQDARRKINNIMEKTAKEAHLSEEKVKCSGPPASPKTAHPVADNKTYKTKDDENTGEAHSGVRDKQEPAHLAQGAVQAPE